MRVSSRTFLAAAFLVALLGSVPAISARQTYPPSEAITYTDIFGGRMFLTAAPAAISAVAENRGLLTQ